MSSSIGTQWTNKTLEALSGHAAARGIPWRLCDDTKKKGTRFLSRQSKPTEGVRHFRLYAWYYIRKVSVEDVLAVLNDNDEYLRPSIRNAMNQQAVYHVVVEGKDPRFVPPGDFSVTNVVTTYLCENLQGVKDEVDRHLFENLSDPSAIQEAMDSWSFDAMLEEYFKSGDTNTMHRQNNHLVARLGGNGNLLHTCIAEGHAETLRLLLERYTWEIQDRTPWRILAEPLYPVGKRRLSAFHRAVDCDQAGCLKVLLEWASRHGHSITELKNAHLRSHTGEPELELTCLELAKHENKLECYNILAPLFGKRCAHAIVTTAQQVSVEGPRVELLHIVERCGNTDVVRLLGSHEVTDATWAGVLEVVRSAVHAAGNDSCTKESSFHDLAIRICCVAFLDDISPELADALLAATTGFSKLKTEDCTYMTDRTLLAFLHALYGRLACVNLALSPTEGIIGPGSEPTIAEVDLQAFGVPARLLVASDTSENLELTDEVECDHYAAALLCKVVKQMGYRADFQGAWDGIISPMQRRRFSVSKASDGFAAFCATTNAFRVARFVSHEPKSDDALEEWIATQELLPTVYAIYQTFYNIPDLLHKEWMDPKGALDVRVIKFLELTLSTWFALAREEDDAWHQWAKRLGTDENLVDRQLAPAVDLFLETLLRMSETLDYASKESGCKCIAALVRSVVPNALFGRLPRTRQQLSVHTEDVNEKQSQPNMKKSLTALCGRPMSLRPTPARARK